MKIDEKLRYKSGIYKIKNIMNNKFYIGQARDLYNRFHTHLNRLKNNKHHNKHLQLSYNKYGRDNFVFEVIDYFDINLLTEKEQYYIDELKSVYNKNLIITNPFIRTFSEEDRALASKLMKDYYKNGGKKTTREILVYDLDGNFIKEYISLTDFAKEHNTTTKIISKSLKYKTRKFRNFQLTYKSDNIIISKYKRPKNKPPKFTKDQLIKILKLKNEGMKQKDIALIFNVKPAYISNALNYIIKLNNYGE